MPLRKRRKFFKQRGRNTKKRRNEDDTGDRPREPDRIVSEPTPPVSDEEVAPEDDSDEEPDHLAELVRSVVGAKKADCEWKGEEESSEEEEDEDDENLHDADLEENSGVIGK
jgi:hypothetical protein